MFYFPLSWKITTDMFIVNLAIQWSDFKVKLFHVNQLLAGHSICCWLTDPALILAQTPATGGRRKSKFLSTYLNMI